MKSLKLAVLAGDGIGPELMEACLPFQDWIGERCGVRIHPVPALVGWAAYDVHGTVMPEETWRVCHESDAILFGAVGLPGRDEELPKEERPERKALLPIRHNFGLGVNIRPVRVFPGLESLSPLKNNRAAGVHLTFFRELIGGDYFGERHEDPNGDWAEDVCRYERWQIESIARVAFARALRTGETVTSIDKANVLGATGTFWRRVVQELHDRKFPNVKLQHVFVDAFNLYLMTRPADFQIVLTSNAQGDTLSDGGAGIAGSMGMLASASINPKTGYAMYEPAGGSAPTIAGTGRANPIAMVLSIALLVRYTMKNEVVAREIELAVAETLAEGWRTDDITDGTSSCSTREMVAAIRRHIR
ncbi:MAG: 3-isopropylmalate dehydrogenase [Patescibacteria group bacterium]|jgi:3-isopropylmalate dehydrogenase